MLHKQLKQLNKEGIPYSYVAKIVGCDRSHISRYASGQGKMSLPMEMELMEAIKQIKEGIKDVGIRN